MTDGVLTLNDDDDEISEISGGLCTEESLPLHADAVTYAESCINRPFVLGASGPNAFDNSGLVMWCYHKIGIALPHYAEAMFSMAKNRVPAAMARPGDVLYRQGHVAISTGGLNCIEARQDTGVQKGGGRWTCALQF